MAKEFAEQRDALARVLRGWININDPAPGLLGQKIAKVHRANADRVSQAVGKMDLPVDLQVKNIGYLVGPQVNDGSALFQPFANVQLEEKAGTLNVCLRFVLLHLTQDASGDRLVADGWRLDSAELGPGKPRPWHHAQRIATWGFNGPSLLEGLGLEPEPTGTTPNVPNETYPAFPLKSISPAGLAIAMIASIYGGEFVKKNLVDADTALRDVLNRTESNWFID